MYSFENIVMSISLLCDAVALPLMGKDLDLTIVRLAYTVADMIMIRTSSTKAETLTPIAMPMLLELVGMGRPGVPMEREIYRLSTVMCYFHTKSILVHILRDHFP